MKERTALAFLVALPAPLQFEGCTVTGRMLGSGIVRRLARGVAPDSTLVASAEGHEAVVRTRDHRRHVGRVARIATTPESRFVCAVPLPRNDGVAPADPQSVRVPLREVESIARPGTTAETLLGAPAFWSMPGWRSRSRS